MPLVAGIDSSTQSCKVVVRDAVSGQRVRRGSGAHPTGAEVDPLEAMRFADGSTGAQVHNRHPLLLHRATREAIEAYVADHPDRGPWFFVRSGYTGRPGSAAYESTYCLPGCATHVC